MLTELQRFVQQCMSLRCLITQWKLKHGPAYTILLSYWRRKIELMWRNGHS